MWRPKIYIGTSIIDSIYKGVSNSSEISKLLISKCKDQIKFEGYISAFTIIELYERYSSNDFRDILRYLNENDIHLIKFLLPKEIDYLVKQYEHKNILDDEFRYDYYHIATCAYLNIEFYICWNIDVIVNFNNFKKVMHSQTLRGYRSIFQFRTPEYLTAKQCSSDLNEIIFDGIKIKKQQYLKLNKIDLEYQARNQENEAISIVGNAMKLTTLPETVNKAARIPTLEIGKSNLKFQITNFKDEIKNKSIPLLDFDYESIGIDVHFEMFKLEVIEGQEELKNRQLELIYHLPTRYSQQELTQINQDRNKKFIDWILPEIRLGIDNNGKEFNEIQKEWIKRYHYREIDQNLANSIRGESLELIKTKAIELNKFITQKAWQYYRGFSFPQPWCNFNEGYDHGEFTHIITEKDGKEIWIIFVNEIIP